MPAIARVVADRPPQHGRVVEVHERKGPFAPRDTYDMLVILWAPTFGVHSHTLTGIKGKARAIATAERIGQADAQRA